jgi:hypothetical protein
MAMGILRQEKAAPARIWLLLRHLDREGRGWLRIDNVKQHLTHKDSSLRVCSWRQLRNLLHQGQDTFWHRDEERLWLRSVARVATALGVERLSGRPVALPLSVLLRGIGDVRAHLYASFHSGRRHNNPISRRTLAEISGVPARTQREYEEIAGIVSRRNIAIGEKYTPESVQKRAWLHGTASFDFIDHHGRQGPSRRHYIAWHLPNSYEGCHQRAPKGRMRKINREIDLVNKRAQGNGLRDRLFHSNGATAGKAYGRNARVDAYWHSESGRRKREGLWHVLSGWEGA